MNSDLVIGGLVSLLAFLLMVMLILYNRRIVETIYKKNISHIREIKNTLEKGSDSE